MKNGQQNTNFLRITMTDNQYIEELQELILEPIATWRELAAVIGITWQQWVDFMGGEKVERNTRLMIAHFIEVKNAAQNKKMSSNIIEIYGPNGMPQNILQQPRPRVVKNPPNKSSLNDDGTSQLPLLANGDRNPKAYEMYGNCRDCGKPGHFAGDEICEKRVGPPRDPCYGRCFHCGSPNH